uniref:hypothetical protein n=1 Tax=Agathobacter sp. TaxID=2021311 RepID=UPI00405752FF
MIEKGYSMNCYIKMELKRAFVNKRMVLALIFGIGLSIWHYFAYIYPIRDFILSGEYCLSSYNKWLGGESYSLQSTLFYMFIPIVCALPYGESWMYDCKSSIGGQAIIRGSKKTFVLTKMVISFLSGATIAVLPLLFDFALTSSTLPAIIPKVSLGLSPIGTEALMGELFYEHPLIYTLVYIGLNGLFFGLLNTFSITARMFTSNRYLAVLTPYLFYMVLHCVGTTTLHFELCPTGFLRPCQQFLTTWLILIFELLLMMTISVISAIKYTREEHGLL